MTSDSKYSPNPEKRARIQRIMNVMVIVPALSGIFYLLYYVLRVDKDYYRSESVLIAFAMMGVSAMVLLMRYLQTGAIFRTKKSSDEMNDSYFQSSQYKLEKQIKEQQAQINKMQSSINESTNKLSNIKSVYEEFTSEQREQLVSDLKNRIQNSATEECIKEIKDQILIKTEREMILEAMDDKCSESITRLNKETSALSRRGNLNLVLGIFTTIAGLIILYVYVSKIVVDPLQV